MTNAIGPLGVVSLWSIGLLALGAALGWMLHYMYGPKNSYCNHCGRGIIKNHQIK